MRKRTFPAFAPKLAALALLAAAGHASAQSTVTIYGILDSGLRYSNGLTAANAGSNSTATAINSGIDATSRFGFRGVEDLGGGLKATFNLESGINLDTGASVSATKLFDRAATVGLQGGWGGLTLGRQTTTLVDAMGAVDPLGVRFAAFNPNVTIAALNAHQLGIEYGPAGAATGSYRLDNSVKYVGQFDDFSVRAMHGFGEQATGNSRLNSSGIGAGYQSSLLTAALAYSEFKSATGLALKAYIGGASTTIGTARLALTYASHEAETTLTAKTKNRTIGFGGTLPLSPSIDLVAAHYQVKRTRTALVDDGFNRTIAFLEYKLSKRSRLYAELDHTRWKNNYQGAGLKGSGSGVSLGVMHTF